MFEYYTTLLVVTSSIILSALIITYNDDVLKKFNRNIFIISYIILQIILIFEWLAVYLERTNSSLHFFTTFSMGLVLFLSASISAILAWGINDVKSKSLSAIVISIVVLNFMVGFSGLFSDAIFYYDEQNIYHRGEYFAVQLIMVMISALTLLINTFRLGIKYQNKNNYVLVLDFFIFLGALFAQFLFNGIWILWISVAISIAFVHVYYSSYINQVDVLTGILNKKCYVSQLYDLNSEAIIQIFDVNKFKEINDTLGHTVGDYCLIQIANAIKEVYGKSGYCYRVGGDEFSVILIKNLDSLDELNTKFSKKISEKNYNLDLPTVSIGHCYYYPKKSSIQKVIEEADAMMYLLKKQQAS